MQKFRVKLLARFILAYRHFLMYVCCNPRHVDGPLGARQRTLYYGKQRMVEGGSCALQNEGEGGGDEHRCRAG